jgi:hypothetical protein
MYAGSYVSYDGRVEIRAVPKAGFIDPIRLDDITQYFRDQRYGLWPSKKYFSKGGSRLHRDVWADAFGKIPPGCHIHHRDNDRSNNMLWNLECMPASAHLSESWKRGCGKRAPGEHFTDNARKRSAEWHSSEVGRLWHKRNAVDSGFGKNPKRELRDCEYCRKPYMGLVRKRLTAQKYCTEACKAASYRERRASERAVGGVVPDGS